MGTEGKKYPMVIMTNGDVYRVTREDAKNIAMAMADPDGFAKSFETTDAKTHAEITVTIANISSTVIPAEVSNV